MKMLNRLAALPLLATATPALAATEDGNDTAVWIALGVVFLGSFTAIGGGLLAAMAKKKKQAEDQ